MRLCEPLFGEAFRLGRLRVNPRACGDPLSSPSVLHHPAQHAMRRLLHTPETNAGKGALQQYGRAAIRAFCIRF